MHINIYNQSNSEKLGWLFDDDWELPGQIYTLENWVKTNGHLLPKSSYIADIGFRIRKGASGGGGVLSSETMKIMGDIGMAVYFSEYPS
ncbi:MAG: hypothetical protein ACRCVT_08205 [Leadbetterella sp.]